VPHGERAAGPHTDEHDRERPLDFGRVVTGPEQEERDERRGEARRESEEKDALIEPKSRMGPQVTRSQAVSLKPSVKRAAAQPKGFRSLTDVALAPGHGFLDQEPLDVLEAHVLDARARRPLGA